MEIGISCQRRALTLLLSLMVLSGCKKKEESRTPADVEVEILDPTVVEALAVEEKQLEKILRGWKARAYRKTRQGLVNTALGLIGTVEGQSKHPLIENLPPDVRSAIELAGDQAGGLKELAAAPPAEIGLVVATGYLVHLQKTPALCELELIDPERFATAGGRSGFHVVRGVTYFMHGLTQHGLKDLRAANVGSAESLPPEIRTAIYYGAAAAAIAADEPRMMRTQLELAEDISPGDPMIAFLRAEREISKARYAEAARELADWRARNPSVGGLVPDVIDQRREALEGDPEGLVSVLSDSKWMMDFGLDYISEQAVDSAAFSKLDEVTGTARTLMNDLLKGFTGFGL